MDIDIVRDRFGPRVQNGSHSQVQLPKSTGETVVHFNRLVLCEVTANVMSNCFKILGIREVPRM
ncbi:hypothetical protein COOONC_16165 [Cooperia oncophora]